ncbi:hypothetical protein [Natronococcus occultus]|uniref:Uncharacterized protein n=1 Tax=Natronococcus occultus SP4 TaxID=694430 RepID=L0JZW3_9EURY|nr:hypothetical protein [Natronococcus occultus]AGB38597.1 hypothetical protein Natoc_2838 [Natronococcus occultus SP4]
MRVAPFRRVLVAPVTIATFLVLTVPLALGWLRTSLLSPLALPGYLIYTIGSAIGNLIAPRFELWAYWIPFVAGCCVVSVTVGYAAELVRAQLSDDEIRR